MAIHFHKLKVKEVRRETPDSVSIVFDIPGELKDEFFFKHGQNINLRKYFDGEEVRRSYSICSSPLDNELRIGVKKAFNGLFSGFANDAIKKGDEIEVMSPSGNFFTELDPANKKNYFAFAAGSGITPILSIIKTTLATEPKSTFTLVFGNRTHNSIMFKEDIEALKDKYMERFSLYHILSREIMDSELNHGRIDKKKIEQLSKVVNLKRVDDFFICGPEEMIFCVKDFLEQEGIGKNKIHFELFTTPVKHTKIYRTEVVKENDDSSKITVKLDGRSFDFNLEYNSNTILEAALAQGADLPFACKGGVCTTCKAKLVEGKVEMEVNYGLEQEEVNKGFILTCQSHPRSEKVVVDFDVN